MTSLIDVIFLLLLFFMLTKTFSKFSEVELASASAGGSTVPDQPPIFLQLGPEEASLNGAPFSLAELQDTELSKAEPGTIVLVSLREGVTAQRLTDLLVALREILGISLSVLGS